MSAALPVPPETGSARVDYVDSMQRLSFETASGKQSIVDFYRQALVRSGWEPTRETTVEVDDKDVMIFLNAAKDLVRLELSRVVDGKMDVEVSHQTAAEIADLRKRIEKEAAEKKRQ